jgi:hypothetical protein
VTVISQEGLGGMELISQILLNGPVDGNANGHIAVTYL